MSDVTLTFEGVEVKLGKDTYVIPPLSLKLIRKHQSSLATFGSLKQGTLPTPDQLEKMFVILTDAIQRNYPDLSPETLEDLVDIKNMPILFKAIMGQSGLEESDTPKE